jgi:hypothetical protein
MFKPEAMIRVLQAALLMSKLIDLNTTNVNIHLKSPICALEMLQFST